MAPPAKSGSVRSRTAASNAMPIRGRPPRAVIHGAERRRRKSGTLNRMAQFKLDVFSDEQLDAEYIYRWVDDIGSRLRVLTKQDDYDFVNADEIADFSVDDMTDSESGQRLRMIVGEKKNGDPLYSYLLRKRRDFWESDNADAMDYRDDVLAGRVYRGEINDVPVAVADKDGGVKTGAVGGLANSEEFYVPPEAHLEHGLSGGSRRRSAAP